MKDVLMKLLTQIYKVTETEAAELLEKTDETEILNDILAKDKLRVKTFTDQITKASDIGHKKGKGEALYALENELKEKFGITNADLKGIELIDAIVEEQSKTAGQINEDSVKKHAAYLQLEKQLKTKERDVTTEWQKKLDAVQNEYKQKEVQGVVRNKALEILDSLNPVLPADATKANKVKSWFLTDLLTSNKFEVTEDGTILLLDKEGQPLKDEHGYTKAFDDVVKEVAAQSLELTVSQPRSSAANGTGGNGAAGGQQGGRGNLKSKIPIPKDAEGLSAIINDNKIPLAERQEIMEAFESGSVK